MTNQSLKSTGKRIASETEVSVLKGYQSVIKHSDSLEQRKKTFHDPPPLVLVLSPPLLSNMFHLELYFGVSSRNRKEVAAAFNKVDLIYSSLPG